MCPLENALEHADNNALVSELGLYKNIMDHLPHGFVIFESVMGPSGKIIDFCFIHTNTVFEKMSKKRQEDLVGKSASSVFPDHDPALLQGFIKALASGGPVNFTWDIPQLGKTFDLMVIRMGQTKFALFLSDASARVDAQSRSKQLEDALLTFIRSLKEPAFIFDTDFHLQIANESFEQTQQLKVSEVKGTKFLGRLDPKVSLLIESVVDEVVQTQRPVKFPLSNNGRYLEATMYPVFDSNGKVKDLAVLTDDITESKKAERAIRESEERYRLLADNMTDVIVLLDPELMIKYLSPSVHAMLGYRPEDILTMPFDKLVDPDSFLEVLDKIEDAFLPTQGARGKVPPTIMTLKLISKRGERIWAEVKASFFYDHNGKITGLMGVIRDITDRKRAEELEKETARFEVNSFVISALPVFASGVSPMVRDALIAKFSERFEKYFRPRWETALAEYLTLATRPAGPESAVPRGSASAMFMEVYLKWLSELFTNLGTNTTRNVDGEKSIFEAHNCPWLEEAGGNPVFCLLHRAMILRSYSWVIPNGSAAQSSSIIGGDKTCRFVLRS